VNKFTADFLSPLESFVKHAAFSPHVLEFGCCLLPPRFVEEGKRALNKTLYECMVTGRSDLFIPPIALFILGGAVDDGITCVFQEYMRYSEQHFHGLMQEANHLGHPSFLSDKPTLTRLLKQHARRRFWDSILSYRVVTPGPSFVQMLTTLRRTIEILSKEPIMVDTGQFKERLQQRTYADMENQIANEIAQLDNFHARVKIVSGEHVIRTHPAPQGLSGDLLEARLTRIKRQMRFLGYVRDARDVDEEVRKRHERLRGNGQSDEPPPTHF
jgi:hypothetical protein